MDTECYLKLTLLGKMLVLVLVMQMLVLPITSGGKYDYCPEPQDTPDFRYTKGQPQTMSYSCESSHLEIHCCADGYISIQWQKLNPASGEWKNVQYGFLKRPENKNQTLAMKTFLGETDAGNYRCVLHGKDGIQRTNRVNVTLQDCTDWQKPPLPMQSEMHVLHEAPGNTVKVACRGFFGMPCLGFFCDDFNQVHWTKTPTDNTSLAVFYLTNSSYPVYEIKDNSREDEGVLESMLVFQNVSEADYGEYTCWLSNGYGEGVKSKLILQDLPKGQPVMVEKTSYKLLGWIIGSITLAMGVTIIIYVNFRYEIKVFIRDRFTKSPSDDMLYDVFLLYCDESPEDRLFVLDDFCPKLTEKYKYKVHRAEMDFEIPSVRSNCYVEAVEKSRCIVVMLTPDLLQDEWCSFALKYAVSDGRSNFVFIRYKPIPSHLWSEDDNTLRASIKVCHSLKWPETSSRMRMNRFWTKLHSMLPVPSGSSETSDQESSLWVPLNSPQNDITVNHCDVMINEKIHPEASDNLNYFITNTCNGTELMNKKIENGHCTPSKSDREPMKTTLPTAGETSEMCLTAITKSDTQTNGKATGRSSELNGYNHVEVNGQGHKRPPEHSLSEDSGVFSYNSDCYPHIV